MQTDSVSTSAPFNSVHELNMKKQQQRLLYVQFKNKNLIKFLQLCSTAVRTGDSLCLAGSS